MNTPFRRGEETKQLLLHRVTKAKAKKHQKLRTLGYPPFMEKLIQGQPGWGAPQPPKKINEIQLFDMFFSRKKHRWLYRNQILQVNTPINMSNNWISLLFLGGWGAPQPGWPCMSFSIKGAIKLIIACAHPFFNDFCKIPQKNCKYFSCGHFDLVCIVRFLNFVFDFVKNLVLSCSLRKKKIKICKKRSEIFFNENRDFFGFCDLISAKFWIFSSSSCRFWV